MEKIRMHCERSCVPIGAKYNTMTVPNFVSDILVIQGKVKDYFSNDVFLAPTLIPRNVSKILLVRPFMYNAYITKYSSLLS